MIFDQMRRPSLALGDTCADSAPTWPWPVWRVSRSRWQPSLSCGSSWRTGASPSCSFWRTSPKMTLTNIWIVICYFTNAPLNTLNKICLYTDGLNKTWLLLIIFKWQLWFKNIFDQTAFAECYLIKTNLKQHFKKRRNESNVLPCHRWPGELRNLLKMLMQPDIWYLASTLLGTPSKLAPSNVNSKFLFKVFLTSSSFVNCTADNLHQFSFSVLI